MRRALVLLMLLIASGTALAWKHGSVFSGFDPNSMGGGWSCWGPTGSCGPGTFANTFDAACAGGGTSNATALANWWAYGHSLGTTLAKLMIPPGTSCSFGTNQSLACDSVNDNASTLINNAYIWARGASWDRMQLGGNAFISDNNGQGNSSAFINTASAGATSVTVNDGNIGLFSTGNWILVTALAGQAQGFGPTHQFHEHRKITGIAGNVISFSGGLVNTYKSTYPNFNTNGQTGQGGPAAIYKMANCFDTTVTYDGITLTDTVPQNNMAGNSVTLLNVTNLGGIGPGGSPSFTITGGFQQAMEIDKDIGTLTMSGVTVGGSIVFQSSSPNTMTISNSTVSGGISGTPIDLTITNTTITGDLQVGPTCCGTATSLTLNTVSFANGRPAGQEITSSSLSYSSGNFTISSFTYPMTTFPGLFVPGFKYFLGDSHGDNTCTPLTTFTVSDISQASTTVTISTDLVGALPTLSCSGDGGANFSTIARYQLKSLSQTNVTTPGTTLLSWSKMLAPP